MTTDDEYVSVEKIIDNAKEMSIKYKIHIALSECFDDWRGTAKVKPASFGMWQCDECGETWWQATAPRYCPECGRKAVVDEIRDTNEG